jgi:molybdopterin molybdotransferase
MSMRTEIELETAQDLLLSVTEKIADEERIPLSLCFGRILSRDLLSLLDQPPFDRAAMDGYALRKRDIGKLPFSLPVVGEEDAGEVFSGTVPEGSALRIMTGAPIPEGIDLVVPQESTDCGKEKVTILSLPPRSNITLRGADGKKGARLLPEGSTLTPAAIALAASQGMPELPVVRRPRVLVVATGDEVTAPGKTLFPGKIYDSNAALLEALLPSFGAEVMQVRILPDDPEQVEDVIRKAEDADLVVTTGGVSVGVKDIFHSVYPNLGVEPLFWKVRIKPGMPVMAGVCRGMPVISLSGNPYGVFVHACLLVQPVLLKMLHRDPTLKKVQVSLSGSWKKGRSYRRFVRAVVREKDGKLVGTPFPGGSASSLLVDLPLANALLEIPEGETEVEKGTKLFAYLL